MEFSLREPGHRGDPMDFGNFSIHPIPHKFSRKIREIFKILAWIGHFGGRKEKLPFSLGHRVVHSTYTRPSNRSSIHSHKGRRRINAYHWRVSIISTHCIPLSHHHHLLCTSCLRRAGES